MGCSPWGRKESDTTKRLNDNNINKKCTGESLLLVPGTELLPPGRFPGDESARSGWSGGPVVRTFSSNARGEGLIPGGGSHMLYSQNTKT